MARLHGSKGKKAKNWQQVNTTLSAQAIDTWRIYSAEKGKPKNQVLNALIIKHLRSEKNGKA